MRARHLDVSELEPPEPMQRVLAALPTLADDEYLVMHHRREPFPLYIILATMDYEHHTRAGDDAAFEVLIWRRTGPAPEVAR